MKRKKVLVWLSGGVDSAVSAYLLKEQGYDVSAGFMINYLTDDDSCPTRVDMAVAQEVAAYLDIPFFTFDFIAEYEKRVLNYIFEGYKQGFTPNPDVFCNTWIKFDLFRQEALSYGYDAVATGHYARVSEQKQKANLSPNPSPERRGELSEDFLKISDFTPSPVRGGAGRGSQWEAWVNENYSELLRWIDPEKDQSYFLSALSREQLEQVFFPIGNLEKSEVREIARKAGLPNAERKDSQGLCFVGKVDFASFLKSHIPTQKWVITDTQGNILGEHDGAFQFTIGQRKGIGVGGGPALYVLEKDVKQNIVIVWEENDSRLFRTTCTLTQMNWLADVTFPLHCEAQIRYRQKAQKCLITHLTPNPSPKRRGETHETPSPLRGGLGRGEQEEVWSEIEVIFSEPQRAITPGQVCALYDGDRVLGSGIIASAA